MSMKTILAASVLVLATNLLTATGESKQQATKKEESIRQQKRVIALHEQLKNEQGFTLELAKNHDGTDALKITNTGLPAMDSGVYEIYLCWLDEPAAPGGWPLEKRMERIGREGGNGRFTKNGVTTISYGKITTTILLRARHPKRGDYYGRGRVCVMAVSGHTSFLTNIVTVPEKPSETSVQSAEELRTGGDEF